MAFHFPVLLGNHHSPTMPLRPFASMIAFGLALCFAGVGCQTNYGKLVTPFPDARVLSPMVEVGTCSIRKKKIGIFHQPSIGAHEAEEIAKGALQQVPQAEFFSDYNINAVLHVYPSPRLPIFYCLEFQISGVVARTNTDGTIKSKAFRQPE